MRTRFRILECASDLRLLRIAYADYHPNWCKGRNAREGRKKERVSRCLVSRKSHYVATELFHDVKNCRHFLFCQLPSSRKFDQENFKYGKKKKIINTNSVLEKYFQISNIPYIQFLLNFRYFKYFQLLIEKVHRYIYIYIRIIMKNFTLNFAKLLQ